VDPLTQSAFGAAAAAALSDRRSVRCAAAVGAFAGAAPDLDVLIGSASDPLVSLEYHRHFTHALAIAPAIGLAAAGLGRWLFRRRGVSFAKLATFGVAGALTHGALDACTGYGTLLYWPFGRHREAFDLISIIDPVFTLPLLLLLGLAVARRRPRRARAAVALCLVYLAFGWAQRERAEHFARELAAERGHSPEMLRARPSVANIVLWRVMYREGGTYYVDAVSLLPWRAPRLYPGGTVEVFTPEDAESVAEEGSVQARDIERFRFFAHGYLYRVGEDRGIVADLRYAALPDSLKPLWGIRLDASRPDEHVRLEYFRDASGRSLKRLWRMILNRSVSP